MSGKLIISLDFELMGDVRDHLAIEGNVDCDVNSAKGPRGE